MTIGEKILTMRKARGWSQEELAERVGVTRQAVSRWESDAAKPDAEKLVGLCKLFGVSADYLLGLPEAVPVTTASPRLLDRTAAGWILIVLSALVIAVALTLLLLFQGGFFWMFWLGVSGVLIGVALAPGARYLQDPEFCTPVGNIAMGVGWACIILWACCFTHVQSLLVLSIIWPALMCLILGYILTRIHKK